MRLLTPETRLPPRRGGSRATTCCPARRPRAELFVRLSSLVEAQLFPTWPRPQKRRLAQAAR